MVKLSVKDMDIETGGIHIAILNKKDAKKLDLHSGNRVVIKKGKIEVTCILDIARSPKSVAEGQLGLFEEVIDHLHVKNNDKVKKGRYYSPLFSHRRGNCSFRVWHCFVCSFQCFFH